MNESGLAVRGLATRFGIDDPADHRRRARRARPAAGHGAGQGGRRPGRPQRAALDRSPTCTSTDFLRVRIGVGKPPERGPGRVARAAPAAQGGARAAGRASVRDGGRRGRAHRGGRARRGHGVVPLAAQPEPMTPTTARRHLALGPHVPRAAAWPPCRACCAPTRRWPPGRRGRRHRGGARGRRRPSSSAALAALHRAGAARSW